MLAKGAPYTGLKPAGTVEPAVAAADKSIAEGSADELAEHIASAAKAAVKERFEKLQRAKEKKDENVKAGREYVEAYVQYIHFVEGIHNMVAGQGAHEHAAAASKFQSNNTTLRNLRKETNRNGKSLRKEIEMFCYQCEQTAGGSGCTKMGVCGKSPETADLQDLLVYAAKGIAMYASRAAKLGHADRQIDRFVVEALFSTVTNVNFDPVRLEALIAKAGQVIEQAKAHVQ